MENRLEAAKTLALRIIREGVGVEVLEAVTEAWRILGFKRIAQTDYEGALELFLEVTENLAARFGVDGKPASFLSGIGSAYHHLGFYATAESYLEEAKGKLDGSSPYRVRASVHNNLGLILYLSGDRERAERELRTALAACEGSGDEACVVYVLTNLASVLGEDGKAEESERVYTQILERAKALEAKDDVTGAHVRRAARYVGVIAAALIDDGRPDIDRAKAELFAATAKLHDIGKLVVPDAILQKPGRFDETVRYILGCCGSQFGPAICAAFERSAGEFNRIFSEA